MRAACCRDCGIESPCLNSGASYHFQCPKSIARWSARWERGFYDVSVFKLNVL